MRRWFTVHWNEAFWRWRPLVQSAVAALSRLQADIEGGLNETTPAEERDALEALLKELGFKKETSIRRRVRQLVLEDVPLSNDARQALARRVVKAYDLRGKIVHEGKAADQELGDALNAVRDAVSLILRSHLGLAD